MGTCLTNLTAIDYGAYSEKHRTLADFRRLRATSWPIPGAQSARQAAKAQCS